MLALLGFMHAELIQSYYIGLCGGLYYAVQLDKQLRVLNLKVRRYYSLPLDTIYAEKATAVCICMGDWKQYMENQLIKLSSKALSYIE